MVANVICGVLVLLAVGQLMLVAAFARSLWGARRGLMPDEQCVRALVVLSLRGSDPFLRDCISALATQDYPNFDIRIVIDRVSDPAWQTVQVALSDLGVSNAQVEPLEVRRVSCSLKCSSVLQAVSNLGETYGFVALLDADTVPHPSWLRELAGALEDDSIGAATGNRWYFPAQITLGSTVRYVWNAAAVVQMYIYGIAWGGTLAVKTELLQTAGLCDRWGRAFCEDTMIASALKPLGKRVAFVPALMMVNRESCTLRGFEEWVRRQLLTVRLYHSSWPAVAGHGLVTSLALGAAVLMGATGAVLGQWSWLWMSLAGFLFYQAAMIMGLLVIECSVRRIVRARGEVTGWLTPFGLVMCGAAILFTQLLYPRSLFAALRLRAVTWRGARYEIDGPWQVRLVADQAVAQSPAASGSNQSL